MYASVVFVGINNLLTVQPAGAVKRTVYYRERAAGMYTTQYLVPYHIKYNWEASFFSVFNLFSGSFVPLPGDGTTFKEKGQIKHCSDCTAVLEQRLMAKQCCMCKKFWQ